MTISEAKILVLILNRLTISPADGDKLLLDLSYYIPKFNWRLINPTTIRVQKW